MEHIKNEYVVISLKCTIVATDNERMEKERRRTLENDEAITADDKKNELDYIVSRAANDKQSHMHFQFIYTLA